MEIEKIKVLKKKLDEMNIDGIVRGEIKEFGTSAHIIISRKYLGKKTITLILKK